MLWPTVVVSGIDTLVSARSTVSGKMVVVALAWLLPGTGSGSSATTEAVRSHYREAFNWINRRSEDYIFDFESVCEALGIDADYLRLGLINACLCTMGERKRSRRSF